MTSKGHAPAEKLTISDALSLLSLSHAGTWDIERQNGGCMRRGRFRTTLAQTVKQREIKHLFSERMLERSFKK